MQKSLLHTSHKGVAWEVTQILRMVVEEGENSKSVLVQSEPMKSATGHEV
jgi:hypothetical protein